MSETSDPLWYYEIRFLDGWRSRTSAYRASNTEAKNGKRAIRNAASVAEEHKGLSLNQLKTIYGVTPGNIEDTTT